MPMKPAKWGFKVFVLCESRTGYCIRHIFYDGDKYILDSGTNIISSKLYPIFWIEIEIEIEIVLVETSGYFFLSVEESDHKCIGRVTKTNRLF